MAAMTAAVVRCSFLTDGRWYWSRKAACSGCMACIEFSPRQGKYRGWSGGWPEERAVRASWGETRMPLKETKCTQQSVIPKRRKTAPQDLRTKHRNPSRAAPRYLYSKSEEWPTLSKTEREGHPRGFL